MDMAQIKQLMNKFDWYFKIRIILRKYLINWIIRILQYSWFLHN